MMADISTKTNWQRLIDVVNRHKVEWDSSPTRPATDEEIESLRRRAAQKGLGVEEDFVTFLRYANGISFNGLTIPSAELPPQRPFTDDFVVYNDSLSFIEIGPVYGNMDDSYYVLYPDGKFRCISASEDVLSTYNTFFEMITAAIAEAVGPSVIDSDNVAEIYASLSTTA